jgi:hypothetical protein
MLKSSLISKGMVHVWKKKIHLKKIRIIRFESLNVLKMPIFFSFVSSFEHIKFLINGKYSKNIYDNPNYYASCRNLSLGLMIKARVCKNASQEGSLRITFHAPRSAKECEGMNPHTPKGTPTLGIGVPVDSRIFRE